MKLTDLSPQWFGHGDNPRAGFVFKCPGCSGQWLSCKCVAITTREQMTLFHKLEVDRLPSGGCIVVTTRPEFAWAITGDDFHDLTVTPSLDASACGHWHGYIKSGLIVPEPAFGCK